MSMMQALQGGAAVPPGLCGGVRNVATSSLCRRDGGQHNMGGGCRRSRQRARNGCSVSNCNSEMEQQTDRRRAS